MISCSNCFHCMDSGPKHLFINKYLLKWPRRWFPMQLTQWPFQVSVFMGLGLSDWKETFRMIHFQKATASFCQLLHYVLFGVNPSFPDSECKASSNRTTVASTNCTNYRNSLSPWRTVTKYHGTLNITNLSNCCQWSFGSWVCERWGNRHLH